MDFHKELQMINVVVSCMIMSENQVAELARVQRFISSFFSFQIVVTSNKFRGDGLDHRDSCST